MPGTYMSNTTSIEFQIKNTTVDSNVFMATFTGYSNNILRSINANTFTTVTIYGFQLSSLANKPNTSNWWVGAYADGNQSDYAKVIKSIDDGVTWNGVGAVQVTGLYSRNSNVSSGDTMYPFNAYVSGIALKYKGSVLMAGGFGNSGTIKRSIDDGVTWSSTTSSFASETANFSLDASNIWIATGSDSYKSVYGAGALTDTNTIKYSTDQGVTWTSANNTFNQFGYDIAYAESTWLATGTSYISDINTTVYELRYSTDGINWNIADIFGNGYIYDVTLTGPTPPIPISCPMLDDSGNWNVFVWRFREDYDNFVMELYSHNSTSSLASGWVNVGGTAPYFAVNPRYTKVVRPLYARSGIPTKANFFFNSSPSGGPTITSPTQRSYILYQYISITPIQLTATGSGIVYFFISAEELPVGLTFDPLTNKITGTPVQLGNVSTLVYVKDNNGTTIFTIGFTILVPRIIRKQDGAGAYTSLLRQYTEVLGAQNARDNVVLPSQDRGIGEFMSPAAPDVITQYIDPRCKNPEC